MSLTDKLLQVTQDINIEYEPSITGVSGASCSIGHQILTVRSQHQSNDRRHIATVEIDWIKQWQTKGEKLIDGPMSHLLRLDVTVGEDLPFSFSKCSDPP